MEPTVPPVPTDPVPAPLVVIANHSPHPFRGWVRAMVATVPSDGGPGWRHAGARGTAEAVDVWTDGLYSGGYMGRVLSEHSPGIIAPEWPTDEPDPLARYGGPLRLVVGAHSAERSPEAPWWGPHNVTGDTVVEPTFVGEPRISRGSIEAHLRARIGGWVADVFLRAHPGEGWVHGELVLAACDPSSIALLQSLPPLRIQWGDAVVVTPGRGFTEPVVDPLIAGDCQGRAVPFLVVWPRLLGSDAMAWASVQAMASWLVVATEAGTPRLYPQGVPVASVAQLRPAQSLVAAAEPWPKRLPVVERDGILVLDPGGTTGPETLQEMAAEATDGTGNDALAWAVAHHDQTRRVLHTWEHPGLGPNARSGDTGAQEDQCFVRGEAATEVGAIVPSYFAALSMAKRPCQHREIDGGPLQDHLDSNPRGVMWDSRWHWHTGVSPYQGGKVAAAESWQFQGGWAGADVEHWLLFGLAAAHRLTGSPALDLLLDTQARIYPHQWTVSPVLSTSQAYASRAIGWECANAMLLHRELHDRELAARVAVHWHRRLNGVILPHLHEMRTRHGAPVWDVRFDDPRLGTGAWTIPWQGAVGAYWLHVAAVYFAGMPGTQEALHRSLDAAHYIVDKAWRRAGDHWECAPQAPLGREQDAVFDGSFAYFGMSLAVATCVRGGDTGKAADIGRWLIAGARQGDLRWLAPDMVEALR